MTHLLAAFLAGLASACAFEPLGLGPFMAFGFAVLLWLLSRAQGMRSALALGWVFGFGQFALGFNWIATAFTFQSAMPASLGWVAVVLLAAYLAVYPAMAAGLAWRYASGNPLRLGLILAASWLVTEWLRGRMFTGFAWNPAGVALLPTPLAQLSPFIGTYGLSALAVLMGAVYFLAISPRIAARRQAAWLVLGFAGTLGAGLLLDRPAPAGTRLARIVQPNIGQQNKHDPAFDEETYARLTALTGKPADAPRLVFWPEAAIPDFLEDEPGARRRLARLLGPGDVLVTGGTAIERDRLNAPIGGRNSLFILTPDEALRGRYDKSHLVPYGEYLPARPILSAIGLSRLVPGDLDFWPGPGPRSLPIPGSFTRMGVQICYEIVFSGEVVDRNDRPDFLFNPSNDAWFGAWGPPQHLAQAQLRAIEEGIPVIRSTPTGISAVIDARGHLRASLRWHTAGRIDSIIPGALPPTPFARYGNLLSFLFAFALVAAAWFARVRERP